MPFCKVHQNPILEIKLYDLEVKIPDEGLLWNYITVERVNTPILGNR